MPFADCILPHLSIPADKPRFLCIFFLCVCVEVNTDEHKNYLVRQDKCKQSGPSALAETNYGRGGCEHTETDGTICQLWVVHHACLPTPTPLHFHLFISNPFSSSESVLEDCPGHQTASEACVCHAKHPSNHSNVGSVTHPLSVSSLLMENNLPKQPF